MTGRFAVCFRSLVVASLAGLCAGAAGGTAVVGQQLVDLELVLAVDTSSSINEEEYRLQLDGLAAAFRHPSVAKAIEVAGPRGVAVVLVQWAEVFDQVVVVPWTLVRNGGEARALADRIAATRRQIKGGATAISSALEFAVEQIESNAFEGLRKVIDLSGDGRANHGPIPTLGRDRAVARGITVNGLAILNEIPLLDRYFRNNVIGGGGAFVMVAKDWQAFETAILQKLVREISLSPLADLRTRDRRLARRGEPAVR